MSNEKNFGPFKVNDGICAAANLSRNNLILEQLGSFDVC